MTLEVHPINKPPMYNATALAWWLSATVKRGLGH